jgi:ubiquinone/menaquinone biosynthesis C-methylase UbiE
LNAEQDSALDLETYDEAHGVSPVPNRIPYEVYASIIARKFGKEPASRILEIGAGTGNLTLALCAFGDFEEVHASDISPRFLSRLKAKSEAAKVVGTLKLYLFDAAFLPFGHETFDVVVGHSILHHLLDFEETIRSAYRVLKPGGIAIFGEPMMETSALVYLGADILLKTDAMLGDTHLDSTTKRILRSISQLGAFKRGNLIERGKRVTQLEDKYVFPQSLMARISTECGFSAYRLEQFAPVHDLAELIARQIKWFSASHPAAAEQIDFFQPILSSFTSYQQSMGQDVQQVFAYNVFEK